MSKKQATASQLASARAARAIELENPQSLQEQAREMLAEHLAAKAMIARLRAEREEAGLSLADVAARCGMSRAAISRLECGEAPNPTMRTLSRYAAAIGKRIDWLLKDAKKSGA